MPDLEYVYNTGKRCGEFEQNLKPNKLLREAEQLVAAKKRVSAAQVLEMLKVGLNQLEMEFEELDMKVYLNA